MNPVYGQEEIDSVTDYINSGGWIMEHTKTREMEQMICPLYWCQVCTHGNKCNDWSISCINGR